MPLPTPPSDVVNWARNASDNPDVQQAIIWTGYFEGDPPWNPASVGDNGCSYGWLQYNRCGGLGAGFSIPDLLDPQTEANLMANYLHDRIAGGASLYDALQPWSTREQTWSVIGGGVSPAAGPGASTVPRLGATVNIAGHDIPTVGVVALGIVAALILLE